MKKTTIALTTLIFSTCAFASDFRFAYQANELTSSEKFSALHERLENAARSYCSGEYRITRDLRGKTQCFEDILEIVGDEISEKRVVAEVPQRDTQSG